MISGKKNFLRDERGFAAGEFALWLPIMLLILLGCFEATRYILINQKLDRAATQVADLVGQADGITTGQLNAIYDAAIEQVKPYDLDVGGEIVVSSVYRTIGETNARVVWQRTHGSSLGGSAIGDEGEVAALPTGFTLTESENVIAAEVLYQFQPVFFGELAGMKNLGGGSLFGDMFQAVTFRHLAWARPRGANLVTAP
jgi:hypothetical protein